MSYIEKEKLIKADIASIENKVRHAFNQGYDLGYKEGKSNLVYSALIDGIDTLEQEPKTGHWSRKTKVYAYDIAGVKTWGIKCQCDRCDFTTIVVEDFGYYKYCPNCGCRMVEPQESEDKE